MFLIKMEKNEYGGHHNRTTYGYDVSVPEGWAVCPEEIGTAQTLENFPFGDIEAEEKDGVMVVTKWIAGEMPEPTPMPEPIEDVTWDSMAEAIKEGVNDV